MMREFLGQPVLTGFGVQRKCGVYYGVNVIIYVCDYDLMIVWYGINSEFYSENGYISFYYYYLLSYTIQLIGNKKMLSERLPGRLIC